MSTKNVELDFFAQELRPDIEKAFERFGTKVKVGRYSIRNGRIIFLLEIKKNSRLRQLYAYEKDVQRRLKLPLFSIVESGLNVLLVVSNQDVSNSRLPMILSRADLKYFQRMELPCVIGHTLIGDEVTIDLVNAPHFLMGGASNSGKTTGLQALITSIAYLRSPAAVSFVMIDVGADGLFPFNDIPHLVCPVITERGPACHALASVIGEMKRRNELKRDKPSEFQHLPRIVVVIDELPELMRASDRSTAAFLVNSINSLLERGRHTKIHVVLAAQNPTLRNIKVDLSNATARCAFRCAKRNNADTIIQDCGAKNLPGKGTMYFSFPGNEVIRLQGVYTTPQELPRIVMEICYRWPSPPPGCRFTITESVLQATCNGAEMPTPTSCAYDELYANVLYFTLGQERISAQQLCKQFHTGWPRAADFIEDFSNWRVVSTADAKLPRRVLPQRIEDVPKELLIRLESHGITRDEVQATMRQRSCKHNSFRQ